MVTRQRVSSRFFLAKGFIVVGLFFATIGCIWGLCLFFTWFTIARIEIHIADPENNSIVGTREYYNQSIFLISEQEVAKSITKKNALVESVKVSKVYPYTLRLDVELSTPVAALTVKNGYYILSTKARVIEKTHEKPQGFPLITYYESLPYEQIQLGIHIDYEDIEAALNLSQKLSDLGVVVDTVDISSFHMIACKGEGKEYVFSSDGDISLQEYQLEAILKQLKVQGKEYTKLDFRFDKPVIEIQK